MSVQFQSLAHAAAIHRIGEVTILPQNKYTAHARTATKAAINDATFPHWVDKPQLAERLANTFDSTYYRALCDAQQFQKGRTLHIRGKFLLPNPDIGWLYGRVHDDFYDKGVLKANAKPTMAHMAAVMAHSIRQWPVQNIEGINYRFRARVVKVGDAHFVEFASKTV
jgi:hypothetical protein